MIAGTAVLATSTAALAWGADGHRMLTRVAIGALPAELPPFLTAPQAVAVMSRSAGSQAGVAAAAHHPAAHHPATGVTALRIEGFAPSVAARCALLERLL
eukprot:gene14293-16673_t